jgi:hypothetical protein
LVEFLNVFLKYQFHFFIFLKICKRKAYCFSVNELVIIYDFDIKDGTLPLAVIIPKRRRSPVILVVYPVEGIEISLIVFYVFWKGVEIVLYSFLYNQRPICWFKLKPQLILRGYSSS